MKTAEELLERYGSTLVDDPVAYTRIVQRDALEAAAEALAGLYTAEGCRLELQMLIDALEPTP